MIEPEDLIFPDTAAHPSKLAIPESGALNHATVDSIASKLTGLESTPVIGAFDANHLQQIHARIFRGRASAGRPASRAATVFSVIFVG